MQLTRTSDYGIRGMVYLATKCYGEIVHINDISETQGIPKNLLNKIFQQLAKKGLIKSLRGSKGGFSLAKLPYEISMKEIIEKVDGPIFLNKCLMRKGECARDEICPMHPVWRKMQDYILEVLEKTTLADLVSIIINRKTSYNFPSP